MANNRIQVKRTNTSGRTPNTTNSGNAQYIAAGELALNMADGILYSSNGSSVIEVGANNTNQRITGTLTVNAISANGGIGTAGQTLTSNGTGVYWASGSGTGTVTSIDSGDGLTGGPITTTGTLSVGAANGITVSADAVGVTQGTGVVVNATGVHVNSSYIGTLSANNTTYVNGKTEDNLNVNSALTANNSTNLGGVAAASYQLNSTLAANVVTLTANNTNFVGSVSAANVVSNAQLSGNLANYVTTTNLSNNLANYQTTAGLSANVATLTANNANFVKANNGITSNSSGVFVTQGTGVVVNATGVHVNATYIGTLSANNTTFVNGKTEGNLNVNSATTALTANNSTNLGGVAAASYQLNSTLSANVATLTSNNTSFVGSTSAANVVSNTQLASNLANYVTTTNLTNNLANYQTTAGLSANVATLASNSATYANASITNTFTVGTSTYFVSNGNVGIGTTSPEYKLQVRREGGAGSLGITIDNVFSGSDRSTKYIALGDTNTDTAGHAFYTRNGSATDVLAASMVPNGWFGVGTSEPLSKLHIMEGGFRATNGDSFVETSLDVPGTYYLIFNKSRGTYAAKTAVVSGDQLGGMLGGGYDGSNIRYRGAIRFEVDGAVSSNTIPTAISLRTNSNGNGIERLRITSGGNVGISNAAPTDKFSVNGTTFLGGNVTLGSSGLSSNGSFGTAGHVLHSNGTATYWAADDQGVTSVASGNGITGGTITSTGTLSVVAGTGTVVNSTGVHVNATYIGTLSANNTTYVNGKTEGNLNVNNALTSNNSTYLNGQLASYYTNATNITTGTLPYAQIPANVINTTAAFTRTGITTFSANVVLGTSGLSSNGSFGTAGHVLHSNGTATYWAADDQGVTSVTAGSGLTGGTITGTGTLSVLATSGFTVNSTGLHVNTSHILSVRGAATDTNTAGNGIWRLDTGAGSQPAGTNYGTLISFDNSSDTGFQLASDYQGSNFYFRGGNAPVYGGAGSFSSWREILHDFNYTDYTVTKTGSGASGTWGISITGTANNASYAGGIDPANFVRSDVDDTVAGKLTLTAGANAVLLTNATSNWIYYSAVGVAPPTTTNRSAGTKLILYPGIAASSVDFALGIEANHMWFSTYDLPGGFKWYARNTNFMTANTTALYHTGSVNAASLYSTTNTSTIGTSTYFVSNGNVGISTSTPSYKLEVVGSFAATTKSFVIDHPTKPDMKLRYGSLEGPENGVYVRGRSNTNTIELPDYWTGLVDENTITVNLTPIGKKQDLYVKSIQNNVITVAGCRNFDYYYTVFAERKDVEKLVVEF